MLLRMRPDHVEPEMVFSSSAIRAIGTKKISGLATIVLSVAAEMGFVLVGLATVPALVVSGAT